RVTLHVSFAGLLALALVRALLSWPRGHTAPLVTLLCGALVLAAFYLAGTIAENRVARGRADRATMRLAPAWLFVVTLLWALLALHERAPRLTLALLGGAIVAVDVARAARDAGAVAEVSGHLLDEAGHEGDTPVAGMVVSAGVGQLRAARHRIGVASGAERAPAVLSAVRGDLVDHLVCDTALRDE
ncbi:sugar-binding domain-containing protein, partial [Microbacterium mitrae]|uniref:sugar-binding domain-containing protein n=1 Tax=Microbacterium mitrae TaxID=664640 RepID=UPI0031D6FD56